MDSAPATHSTSADAAALARWQKAPIIAAVVGAILGLIGLIVSPRYFGYSYLVGYIYFLSICAGGLFLVLIHHLFDAMWSTPIRRVTEHLACLLSPVMAILWIPIGIMAPKLYPWMAMTKPDHALHAKEALLNKPMWYGISIGIFVIWWFLSHRLRYWSLRQDETGDARCTYAMRFHSCWGIVAFAVTVTMAIILWVKTLEHQWFSTMYGVYYFAESVWTTLATVYIIVTVLRRTGPLGSVVGVRQMHDLGVLWFAFTVFYAYIHFSQYFIIWNANMPEETFWYLQREKGSWYQIGLLIVFGHFFLPFLALLRIDAKLSLTVTVPLAIWAWLMHFCDVIFNIMPVALPEGFGQAPGVLGIVLGCIAFVGGVLTLAWIKYFKSHPPFPQRDPRMAEALGIYHPEPSGISVSKSPAI